MTIEQEFRAMAALRWKLGFGFIGYHNAWDVLVRGALMHRPWVRSAARELKGLQRRRQAIA